MPTFRMTILGKDETMGRYARAFAALPSALLETMKAEMVGLADYVRASKLSGQVLNRRSGDLSRSITGQAELSGTRVTGIVGTKGVPYAGIHEFGASFERQVTMAFGRPIVPVSATFNYPERSFLRSSATEKQDEISAALRATATETLRAA